MTGRSLNSPATPGGTPVRMHLVVDDAVAERPSRLARTNSGAIGTELFRICSGLQWSIATARGEAMTEPELRNAAKTVGSQPY